MLGSNAAAALVPAVQGSVILFSIAFARSSPNDCFSRS